MFKGAPASNFGRAKTLRNKMTKAEQLVWERLKGNQLQGFKFRRQHPIQKFIVDFYCHKLKLVIEIDGKYHETEEQKQYDLKRSEILKFHELRILRFTNDEIFTDIDSVIIKIKDQINLISATL